MEHSRMMSNLKCILLLFLYSCNSSLPNQEKEIINVDTIHVMEYTNKPILEEVGFISESSAVYYDCFYVDDSVYVLTKHRDKNLYHLRPYSWNESEQRLKEGGNIKLFDSKQKIKNYVRKLSQRKNVVNSKQNIYEKEISNKFLDKLPEGYKIIQKSKSNKGDLFLVLLNENYYLKIAAIIENEKYFELYSNINPHDLELNFLDIDQDGEEEIIIREFYMYDDNDVYLGKIVKLKQESGVRPQEPDDQ